MDGRDPSGEIQRLRHENEALNEQIKLLVKTEQRLYRSQNELDTQLRRLRELARFSLEASRMVSPGEILGHALEVLGGAFALDWVGVLHVDDDARVVSLVRVLGAPPTSGPTHPMDPATWAWLRALHEPVFVTPASDGPGGPVRRLLDAIAPDLAGDGPVAEAHAACAPLREIGGGAGLLVACARPSRGAQPHMDALGEHHLPYLSLLVNHLDGAVENAMLNESLRERGGELARSLATLEQTQQELLQSQKLEAVGRLAGGVAHDFNNLLTVIQGYAGMLHAGLTPGTTNHENVRQILEASQRAATTVRQLLALGRRQMQRREELDLAEQADRTVELLRRLVGENILLRVDLDRTLGPVHADRSQVQQVLLNLVVNARDAMPEGGSMTVTVRPAAAADAARCGASVDPAAFAVLEVEDSGVGMDHDTRSRIFEPFFTTKGPGRGTGLGLAVVYGIVKQSDGHVLVDSAPGEGARFTVLLPLGPGTVPPPAPQPEARVEGARGVILVAEDEVSIREVVTAALREAGHEVFAARDGAEVLELIERTGVRPDLVLTDVVMPRLGGVRLAAALRRSHPGVRIAFMSGYSEDLLREGGSGTDSRSFLAKPFTPVQLVRFVAALLAAQAAAGT